MKEYKIKPGQIVHRTCCECCGYDSVWVLVPFTNLRPWIPKEEYEQKEQEGIEWVFVRQDDPENHIEYVENINQAK